MGDSFGEKVNYGKRITSDTKTDIQYGAEI